VPDVHPVSNFTSLHIFVLKNTKNNVTGRRTLFVVTSNSLEHRSSHVFNSEFSPPTFGVPLAVSPNTSYLYLLLSLAYTTSRARKLYFDFSFQDSTILAVTFRLLRTTCEVDLGCVSSGSERHMLVVVVLTKTSEFLKFDVRRTVLYIFLPANRCRYTNIYFKLTGKN
jgi:hypothetical protein